MENFDIAVIGAGAAGMMCAAVAGQLGRRVVLLDHAEKIGEKIRISGGGRCNFTNLQAGPANYLSGNPHFCRSALARYTPRDFIALLDSYRVTWHEKHRGQLFCNNSSDDVIDVLKSECAAGRVAWRHPVQVGAIRREAIGAAGPLGGASTESGAMASRERFVIATNAGEFAVDAVVIATGGLSIPKIGASDFAFRLAEDWGIPVVPLQPALVPLTFSAKEWAPFVDLAGISLEVGVKTGEGKAKGAFVEDLLLTHRGLSGPAILQISSYWSASAALDIDLMPGRDATEELLAAKAGSRRQLANLLAEWLPTRLATVWSDVAGVPVDARLADLPDRTLKALGQTLNHWRVFPAGTEGWRKAEVTRGGVDTRALSSATMEAKACPGLYFIGESVDVTGWLGGYNFQWAWASAVAAGKAAVERAATLSA